MRVITGSARGRRLITPDGMDVRPTPEKVKEALFSALQFDIEGRRILDLFAGSGQLGIEALSRGAKNAVFVDSSPISIKVIEQNLKASGLEKSAEVKRMDFSSFCAASRDTFDIAFLDPPYREGILLPAIKAVLPLMSDFSTVICEHPTDVSLPDEIGGFVVTKNYRYGKIAITVYKHSKVVSE